jgi:hypothetical protein
LTKISELEGKKKKKTNHEKRSRQFETFEGDGGSGGQRSDNLHYARTLDRAEPCPLVKVPQADSSSAANPLLTPTQTVRAMPERRPYAFPTIISNSRQSLNQCRNEKGPLRSMKGKKKNNKYRYVGVKGRGG